MLCQHSEEVAGDEYGECVFFVFMAIMCVYRCVDEELASQLEPSNANDYQLYGGSCENDMAVGHLLKKLLCLYSLFIR